MMVMPPWRNAWPLVPYMDDDEWCQGWYGYGVEAGQIVEVSCDVDGNWATDSAEVKAHTEAELERVQAELLEESSTQELSYLRHCAEAGEDPLRHPLGWPYDDPTVTYDC